MGAGVLRLVLIALLIGLSLTGCGKSEGPGAASKATSPTQVAGAPLALPATLEGRLGIDHANDWGVWGTLTVGTAEYAVAIPQAVYDASKLGDEGGNARLTLSSKDSKMGLDIYQVSAAEAR